MKNKVVLVVGLVLGLSGGFSPCGAGLFDQLADGFKSELGNSLIKNREKPADRTGAEAINLNQDQSGDYVSVIEDTLCEQPVAEYELSQNLSAIFPALLDGALVNLLGKDPAARLDSAKEDAKKLNWLPRQLEIIYGDKIHRKNIEKGLAYDRENCSGKIAKLYKRADTLLTEVLARFPNEYPYEFRIHISTHSGVNAEALPGGILYISRTALKKQYRDLAAFVLAHEISHVLKRHTTKQFQAQLLDSVTSFEQLQELLAGSRVENSTASALVDRLDGMDRLFVFYAQNQEHQADICAVRLLNSNDAFSLPAGIDLFLKIEAENSGGEDEKRGSHPVYPERRRVLFEAVEKIKN
jgi:hypothetical protein